MFFTKSNLLTLKIILLALVLTFSNSIFAAMRAKTEEKTKECIVCLDEKPLSDFILLSKNRNSTCSTCLLDIINNAFNSKPMADALKSEKIELSPEDVKTILFHNTKTEQEKLAAKRKYDLYENRILYESLESDPNAVHCSTPNCPFVFIDENPQQPREFECPLCHQKYCTKCHEPHNPDIINCEEFKITKIASGNKNIQAISDQLSELALEEISRKCPKCGTRIERAGGCPAIKCSNCGFQFCWDCLQPHDDQVASWPSGIPFVGDPVMVHQCDPSKKKIVDDIIAKAKARRIELEKQLKQEIEKEKPTDVKAKKEEIKPQPEERKKIEKPARRKPEPKHKDKEAAAKEKARQELLAEQKRQEDLKKQEDAQKEQARIQAEIARQEQIMREQAAYQARLKAEQEAAEQLKLQQQAAVQARLKLEQDRLARERADQARQEQAQRDAEFKRQQAAHAKPGIKLSAQDKTLFEKSLTQAQKLFNAGKAKTAQNNYNQAINILRKYTNVDDITDVSENNIKECKKRAGLD